MENERQGRMISVIIPVYNVAPFLEECVNSVRRQTYIDLEIILIDDGSTDGSEKICDDYTKIDSRIHVIHQENGGLSAARNTGIDHAHGEYLLFVDSDDRIHPLMVQVLYEGMIEFSAEIAICSFRKIEEWERSDVMDISERREFAHAELFSGRDCLINMYNDSKPDMIVAWNKLYRRKEFDKLRYPEGKIHEDMFLTYRILYPLNRCLYIQTALYEYRTRKGSITYKKNKLELEYMVEAYYEQGKFYQQQGEIDLYLMALRRYETCLAELILYLGNSTDEKKLKNDYYKLFQTVYREKIKPSKMNIKHKMKFCLFLINKKIYQELKAWSEVKNVQ